MRGGAARSPSMRAARPSSRFADTVEQGIAGGPRVLDAAGQAVEALPDPVEQGLARGPRLVDPARQQVEPVADAVEERVETTRLRRLDADGRCAGDGVEPAFERFDRVEHALVARRGFGPARAWCAGSSSSRWRALSARPMRRARCSMASKTASGLVAPAAPAAPTRRRSPRRASRPRTSDDGPTRVPPRRSSPCRFVWRPLIDSLVRPRRRVGCAKARASE